MHQMLALIGLAALASCAPMGSTVPLNVTQANIARCEYEAEAAPQHYERSFGDVLDNAMRSNHLQKLCLQAKSAENDERLPPQLTPVSSSTFGQSTYVIGSCNDPWSGIECARTTRKVIPVAASHYRPGQPVPAYCSDPQVTNPYLRADCPH